MVRDTSESSPDADLLLASSSPPICTSPPNRSTGVLDVYVKNHLSSSMVNGLASVLPHDAVLGSVHDWIKDPGRSVTLTGGENCAGCAGEGVTCCHVGVNDLESGECSVEAGTIEDVRS